MPVSADPPLAAGACARSRRAVDPRRSPIQLGKATRPDRFANGAEIVGHRVAASGEGDPFADDLSRTPRASAKPDFTEVHRLGGDHELDGSDVLTQLDHL